MVRGEQRKGGIVVVGVGEGEVAAAAAAAGRNLDLRRGLVEEEEEEDGGGEEGRTWEDGRGTVVVVAAPSSAARRLALFLGQLCCVKRQRGAFQLFQLYFNFCSDDASMVGKKQIS